MTTKALYAGSFDPMTNGHLDIITRASKMFDELVVGVIVNPQKSPLFTIEERKKQVQRETANLPNVRVDTCSGLLAHYVNENHFNVVVRGLRATSDFEYEIQMAQMNARLYNGNTDTVFLMTSPEYSFVSSSMMKEVISLNGCVKGLVPDQILDEIKDKYFKK